MAGALAAEVLEMIEPHAQVGVTTGELDRICHDYIISKGAIPAPPGIITVFPALSARLSTMWSVTAFLLNPKS